MKFFFSAPTLLSLPSRPVADPTYDNSVVLAIEHRICAHVLSNRHHAVARTCLFGCLDGKKNSSGCWPSSSSRAVLGSDSACCRARQARAFFRIACWRLSTQGMHGHGVLPTQCNGHHWHGVRAMDVENKPRLGGRCARLVSSHNRYILLILGEYFYILRAKHEVNRANQQIKFGYFD